MGSLVVLRAFTPGESGVRFKCSTTACRQCNDVVLLRILENGQTANWGLSGVSGKAPEAFCAVFTPMLMEGSLSPERINK